jgi:hypothetical protein
MKEARLKKAIHHTLSLTSPSEKGKTIGLENSITARAWSQGKS